jgi:pimeloyl-ACP methyl ester carboxylesterase
MPPPTVTLVIHGTYAAEKPWWKLGSGGDAEPTFADELEARLARRMKGTVWQPALDAGMTYDDFAWSGKNRHKDRVKGAASIAESLGRLAEHYKATKTDKLQVNLVAHSHGGNVALEMLKRLPDTVRVHRLAMLGTPLVRRRATGRVFAIAAAMFLFISLVSEFASGYTEDEPVSNWEVAIVSLIVLPFLLGPYLLVISKPFVWGDRVLAWLLSRFRRGGSVGIPVYGPRAKKLDQHVGAPPTLVTSKEDEADLVLHIGASPREVYDALVKGGDLTRRMRVVEFLFIRGPFSVLVAPLAEALTERFVLGFPIRKVLYNDYEMVDIETDNEYVSAEEGGAIRRVNVSAELLPAIREKLSEWRPTSVLADESTEDRSAKDRHIATMRGLIQGVTKDLSNQMALRHTVYYETDSIIDRVATVLTS